MGGILIAEDDLIDQAVMREAFHSLGHDDIEIVPSAEAALATLENARTGLPACLLLDIRLPGMSGIELLQQIRSDDALRALPVVVYTGSVMQKDADDAMGAGADHFFVKPLSFDAVLDECRKILQRWL